jgi:hypothetical protein
MGISEKDRDERLTFIQRAIHVDNDGCVIWPFTRSEKGYAKLGRRKVSRIVCAAVNGPPPTDTHQSAHSCGNGMKGCISGRHVRWATQLENEHDKLSHGTYRRGLYPQKLNPEKVLAIKALKGTMTQKSIATQFDVERTTIRDIFDGSIWRHVT